MAFRESLSEAVRFVFPDVPDGRYTSLVQFYDEVVLPQELDPRICCRWVEEFLYPYVENPDAIVFVRKLEKDGRRGFRKCFDGDFSYVFADNTLALVFYAMARRGIVPSCDEFKQYVSGRGVRMPCSFKPNGDERSELCAYKYYRHPNARGWKVAHVIDVNAGYQGDYNQFQRTYFTPECLTDWEFDPVLGPVRRLHELPDEDRKTFIAHFLRFANPMNYFLVPGDRAHELIVNGERFGNGIGEYRQFQRYISNVRRQRIGSLYDDLLSRMLAVQDAPEQADEIDLRCYPRVSYARVPVRPRLAERSGDIGFATRMRNLIVQLFSTRAFSQAEVEQCMDVRYCRRRLGLRYPLLSRPSDATVGRYNKRVPIEVNGATYLICNDWYAKNEPLLMRWIEDLP